MPIDDSPHSQQKIEMVTDLASHYNAKVHILDLRTMNDNISEKNTIKHDPLEKIMEEAELNYIRKISKGKNLAVETMDYSKKINADLIVVMTDHESNLKGTFFSGFTKQIINHSRIPVMSIKPKENNFKKTDLIAKSTSHKRVQMEMNY